MDCFDQQPWNVISYRLDSSKLVIEDCIFWVNKLAELGLTQISHWELLKESVRYIPTNTTVRALPCVPRVIRGKKGNVFIDEAAHIPYLKEILDAVRPLSIWGYGITLISSPYLPGLFEELSNDPKWKTHSIDIYAAVDQGLYHKIRSEQGLDEPTEEECKEWIDTLLMDAGKAATHEYLCQTIQDSSGDWLSDASRIINLPVILPLSDSPNPSMKVSKLHVLGVDVGVSENPTVISTVTSEGVERVIELRNKTIPQIARFIKSLTNLYTREIVIDTNGIGRGLADVLKEDGLKVIYCPNTSQWINTQCVKFLSDVWSGLVNIPDDDLVTSDLAAVEMVAGKLIFKQRNINGQKRHCDSIPSLAMAYQFQPQGDSMYL